MPTVSVPFQDLAERIQQQEAELAKLRQELESRRTKLSELTRRKAELQAELAKVDKDIESASDASVPAPTTSVGRTPSTTGSTKTAAKPIGAVSLPKYLVQLVRQAKRPITAKELADEVVRNKFPTTSKNVDAMVKTRVYDLVKKGMLRRVSDSSGVVLADTSPIAKSAKARGRS